jgi:hypothetical protein
VIFTVREETAAEIAAEAVEEEEGKNPFSVYNS